MQRCTFVLGLILILSRAASATTYVVNPEGTGDFPTIQAAIDAVVHGDIIELTDGTFTGEGNRDIDYLGKAITIRSQSAEPDSCIIDCEYLKRGINFHSGEDSNSVLTGITIYRGGDPHAILGGGIICVDSSPRIVNVVLFANQDGQGAGMYCAGEAASPILSQVAFKQNSSAPFGFGGGLCCQNGCSPHLSEVQFIENEAENSAGLYCIACSVTVENSLFAGNSALGGHCGGASCTDGSLVLSSVVFEGNHAGSTIGGLGFSGSGTLEMQDVAFVGNYASVRAGAIALSSASPHLTRVTIVENDSPIGAGLFLFESSPEIENSIIAFNRRGDAVHCYEAQGNPVLSCCDIYGNEGGDWVGCIADQYGIRGNICEDPLFCGPGGGDFTLQDISPCAPFSPPNPECDLIGAWPVGCGQDIEEHAAFPSCLYLAPSSPNPFSQATGITYRIPGDLAGSRVLLNVLDLTGRLVRTLVNTPQLAGLRSISWDGADGAGKQLEAGIYFYRLSVGQDRLTRQMVLVK